MIVAFYVLAVVGIGSGLVFLRWFNAWCSKYSSSGSNPPDDKVLLNTMRLFGSFIITLIILSIGVLTAGFLSLYGKVGDVSVTLGVLSTKADEIIRLLNEIKAILG